MADDAPTTAVEAAAADTTTNAEPSLTSTTGTTSILSDITKTVEHLAPATAPSTNPGTPTHLTGAPTTGTATPFEMDPDQRRNSLNVSLADLSAKANALYAHKSYEEAAEAFAAAAEMQAEMNGEMDPANAEILFMYGRALFRVGQGKSDVLGGKAPEAKGEQKKPKKKVKKVKAEEGDDADKDPNAENEGKEEAAKAAMQEERVAEEAVKIIADSTSGAKKVDEKVEAKKPLFQFTGDENFEESDEEEDDEGEEDEEEDDDLASAFEILDLARVLFGKRLEAAEAEDTNDKGQEVTENGVAPSVRHIKERLADTHDLLAEISLENERYPNAMTDFRQSLKYKEQLYPEDSEVIAEAHFKLSLALEFASVTSTGEDDKDAGPKAVDEELRNEAATELEAAIRSTRLKLNNKEVELATLHSPEDNENTRKVIAEVKEMIADMEQRLTDLQKPPVDLNAALGGSGVDPISGILGAALGESSSQTAARIEEAKKSANNISGLVRKKAKDDGAKATNGHDANGAAGGKRKAEDAAMEGVEKGNGEASKKARLEDAMES